MIPTSETEFVIKKKKKTFPTNESPRLESFTGEFHQTYKERLIRSFSNSSERMKRKKYPQSHSIKPASLWYQNQTKTLPEKKIIGQDLWGIEMQKSLTKY